MTSEEGERRGNAAWQQGIPGSRSSRRTNPTPARTPRTRLPRPERWSAAACSWATTATVKRVLSDPRIAGFAAEPLYRVGKDGAPTRTQSGYRIVRDPESHEPVTICEPIIPPAQWYELQEWLSERARGKGSRASRPCSVASGSCSANAAGR